MILALLYGSDDSILAAAPACEQQPYGTRYWYDCQTVTPASLASAETALIEINDDHLCQQLLNMTTGEGFDDGRQAALAVERYARRTADSEVIVTGRAA